MRFLLSLGLISLGTSLLPTHAADLAPRERILFDDNWRFQKGDPADLGDALSYDKIKPWLVPAANAFVAPDRAKIPPAGEPAENVAYAQPGYNDSKWRKVTLPHDWGIEGPFDQALPGETGKLPWMGIAWYRKTFTVPATDHGRQFFLEIDGAMSYATVWCNGKFVGGWPYGYASWQVDLTPFLKPGAENVLAIRLDNPPESSRWYPGGGIYRNVWLVKTAPVHVAHWGTRITTPQISASTATVKIDVKLDNAATAPAKAQVLTQIYRLVTKNGVLTRVPDASSTVAATSIAPNQSATVTQTIFVKNPRLWSPAQPNLYVAVTSVAQGGKVVDAVETTFGLRTVEFTVNDGLHLNGKRVPIRGVCNHHDLGALGAAFNVRAAQRQLEILREMGVNAIRTSHNPPAPELLDLCDRMGFLVLDELTDTWARPKKLNGYARLFPDWHEADLRALITRDRNHPSVIAWSTGNEIPEQGEPAGRAISKELTAIAHETDPTRLVSAAAHFVSSGYDGFQKTIDLFGYNYKPGEYAKFHAANPTIPLFGSETSSTISSRGEYFFPVTDDKRGGASDFQMSSYDLSAPPWATTPDAEFRGQDENPFVAGEFVWTGFDYIGEPTPYSTDKTNLLNYSNPEDKARAEQELKTLGKIAVPSRSSYFGIVDLAGFKKDRFYLYQAHWRPDLPMAHILPHWNWPERVGQVTPVHVYTSGDEAELFLNGQSLGRKKKGKFEYRLRWDDVKYEPGELKVQAYKNGKPWATDVVKTTGPAAKLMLAADRALIANDGRDLSFVTATVADKDGLLVPRSKNAITFSIDGPGEIVATDNGDATDHTIFASPERKAFNGLALAIVRAKPGTAAAPITLRATAEGLAPAEIVIQPAK
jgi:beta-galactosidase